MLEIKSEYNQNPGENKKNKENETENSNSKNEVGTEKSSKKPLSETESITNANINIIIAGISTKLYPRLSKILPEAGRANMETAAYTIKNQLPASIKLILEE